MYYTTEWVFENYTKYNDLIWNGKLPSFNEVEFTITKRKDKWGFAGCKKWVSDKNGIPYPIIPILMLSNYYDSPEDVKLNTLLHEMCHLYEFFVEPKYLIRNVSRNKYDKLYPKNGHGYIFNQQAERIKRMLNIDITRFVSEDSTNRSEVNDTKKANYLKKINLLGGIDVFVMSTVNRRKGKNAYSKVESEALKNKWINFFNSDNSRNYFYNVYHFKTHDEKSIDMETSRSLTWYYINSSLDDFIKKYNLELVEVIYKTRDIDSISGSTSKEYEKRYKKFSIKFTNGKSVNYFNVTKDDVYQKLRNDFPKWSDDNIKKFTNNDEFYTECMKKDKIDLLIERVLKEKIKEVKIKKDIPSLSDEEMKNLNSHTIVIN